MEINLLILFLALLADRTFGDPDGLWRKIPHPVVLFGKAIDLADKQLNKASNSDDERRRDGFLAMLGLLVLAAALVFWCISALQTILPLAV